MGDQSDRGTRPNDVWETSDLVSNEGLDSIDSPGSDHQNEGDLPAPLDKVNQWLAPIRRTYQRTNRRLDPLREIADAFVHAFETWYGRRNIVWRFVVASGVAEVVFLLVTVTASGIESLVGRDALPSSPGVPAIVPITVAVVALVAFVQEMRTRRRVGLWSDPDDPVPTVGWTGVFSGVVIGASLGSIVSVEVLVIAFGIGAVVGDELERRTEQRVRRAAESRVSIQREVAKEIGRNVGNQIETKEPVPEYK